MTIVLNIINTFLALGTIGLLVILLGYGVIVAGRHVNSLSQILGVRRSLYIVLALSFVSMIVSIYYSDVAGFAPCTLCWYQRIAMYPIALLSAVALFRHDGRHALPYLTTLAWTGLALGLFHINLQAGIVETNSGVCGVGEGCDIPPFVMFGFVTIPIASAVSFAVILAALDLARRAVRHNEHHATN